MQNRHRFLRGSLAAAAFAFVSFAVFAQSSNVQPRITAAIDESRLTTLRGNTHPFARPQFDRGAAPDSLPMQRMLLVLQRSATQEAALETLMEQQQDKSSPNYHAWLTPQQFGQQFGPADSDIQTITSWLESHGFTVSRVSNGRTVIEFSGTAGQVRDAFHTEIHRYNVNNEDHWANASDPQIPAALTPVVAGVWTLHNFLKKPQVHLLDEQIHANVTQGAPGEPPQVTFTGNPAVHALAPADFATIYNFNPNYQVGAGALDPRIGVVARSNINPGDVEGFDSYLPINGLNRAPGVFVILNGPDPGDLGGGEEAEAVLDSSWSGALLVNNPSTVLLVVSESTYTTDGADLSELYIIDNNFADVMTESFGDCEANFSSAEATGASSLAEQAGAEGITYIVSSGDSGAEGCDSTAEQVASGPVSVNMLASTPYTIAVGGTQFNENGNDAAYWSTTNNQITLGSALKYIPEDVWNGSCTAAQCGSQKANILAGGGGASTFFPKPSWQSGVSGIPSDNARDIPDVSLSAAGHDPYLICLHGSCVPNAQGEISLYLVFGTSASAPSFADIMGLVDLTTGSRQGQANYVLYRLAAAETLSQCNGSNTASPPNLSTCIFNDITVGNNAVPGEAGYGTSSAKYQSGTGYDPATGLGSVNIMNLINNWGNARSTPSAVTIFSLNPTTGITHGSPVTVNVTVAPKSGAGTTPTGDVSLIANTGPTGTAATAVDHFTLANGVVTGTTNLFPGGSYTVTAHYEGDGVYTSSDYSPPISVNIAPETSQTQVAIVTFDPNTGQVSNSNATSVTFGSLYTLRITVSGKSGATCPQTAQGGFGCPTGTVTLTDGGSPFDGSPSGSGMFALNSQGYAEDEKVQLLGGSHTLAASYPGDNSFASSASATDSVSITPAPTTISLTANPLSAGLGSFVTLTATVATQSNGSDQGIYPTGVVHFMSGGNAIGSAAVAGSTNSQTGFAQGVATLTTTALPQGQDSITAVYAGDSNYAASSPSNAVTVAVLPPTTTVVTSSNSTISQGASVTFTAMVTPVQSGGPALTGTVQFVANGANIGSAITLSNGQAQMMTTSLPVGADQILAFYSGDSNYGASNSLPISENVSPAPTFTISANPTTIPVSAPGASGSTVLTFTGQNGFSSNGAITVTPTCSGLPSETSCSSGASITIPTNGTATATITFQTMAPSAVVPASRDRLDIGGWRLTAGTLALACLLCAAMLAFGYREKRRGWGIALMFTVFALLAVSVGCGGGGGGNTGPPPNPGTPVGTYNGVSVMVTINGVTQTIPGLTINVE